MRTILLVADCEYIAVPLEIALTCLDRMTVMRASSAFEACEILFHSQHQIAALITDLFLPEKNSFQFIEQVRRAYRPVHLPILVITSDDGPDTPSRLFRLGADAYFLKPFSVIEIRQKLHSLLETRP